MWCRYCHWFRKVFQLGRVLEIAPNGTAIAISIEYKCAECDGVIDARTIMVTDGGRKFAIVKSGNNTGRRQDG